MVAAVDSASGASKDQAFLRKVSYLLRHNTSPQQLTKDDREILRPLVAQLLNFGVISEGTARSFSLRRSPRGR